jgi:predicted N-acyltransferase
MGPLKKNPFFNINPCLLCYSPLSVIGKGLEVDSEYKKDVPEIMSMISGEMEKIAKENNLKYYGFLNITDKDTAINEFNKLNYIKCFTGFEIKATGPWNDFEDYTSAFSSNMRNAIRREIKKHKSNGLEIVIDFNQIEPYADLINKTEREEKGDNYLLPISFYKDLKKNLGEKMFAIYDTKDDHIYSVGLFLRYKDALNYFKFGQNRELTKGTRSIFVIGIYEGVRYVIKEKCKGLFMGTGTYEYKIRRGGKPIPLLLFFKSTSKLNNIWLNLLLALISKIKFKKHMSRIR